MSKEVGGPFFDLIDMAPVVWIDDRFGRRAVPSKTDIVEAVAASIFQGKFPEHPKLSDLNEKDSVEIWSSAIQERMDGSEVETLLATLRSVPPAAGGQDYLPEEMDRVAKALASTIQRMSFEDWASARGSLLPPPPNSVYLVDRENGDGETKTNAGDGIVKELLSDSSGSHVVVVLTHSVPSEGTETLRQELERDLALPRNRLGVASKRGSSQPLEDAIRNAIRVITTQLVSARAAEQLSAVMTSSIAETTSQLETIPLQALDRGLFQSSFEEGISEIEVLTRILLSQQRSAVDKYLASSHAAVNEPLVRLRKLRRMVPTVDEAKINTDTLQGWRQDEVFVPGDRLNALLAPIACGDIFEKHGKNASSKLHVLLGPPCDMAVRSKGTRCIQEAVFVELGRLPKEPHNRFFEVPGWKATGLNSLDFRCWKSVNLECVEWVAYNDDGHMRMPPTKQTALLPGWEIRLANAKARLTQPSKYHLSITLPSGLTEGTGNVEFPYRRIGRLREPWASAAFLAFSNFQARSAFDHDYSDVSELETQLFDSH